MRYSEHEPEAMHQRPGYKFRRRHIITLPLHEFKVRFIKEKGYKDGWHGLMLAFLFAAYRVVCVVRYWDKYRPTLPDDSKDTTLRYVWRLLRDK